MLKAPFEAPVKLAEKAVKGVGDLAGKAVKGIGDLAKKGLDAAGKVVAPVAKVVEKVAGPVSDIAGTIGGVASVGAMFFPPLAGVAGVADAISLGAGLAKTGSKLVDGDPNTNLSIDDAMPLLSMFP